jgi:TonB family protein
VKVRFTISGDGGVDSQSVAQTTLKSAMVEECILRRIATWKFPTPKGGTKVLVSYPFLFKSVN